MFSQDLPQPLFFQDTCALPIVRVILSHRFQSVADFFGFANFRWAHEFAIVVFVAKRVAEDVGQPAGHSGTKIHSGWAEDDDDAGGPLFAAVMADAFDDSER